MLEVNIIQRHAFDKGEPLRTSAFPTLLPPLPLFLHFIEGLGYTFSPLDAEIVENE